MPLEWEGDHRRSTIGGGGNARGGSQRNHPPDVRNRQGHPQVANRIVVDEKYARISTDLDWYLKLLNSLCGEHEGWSAPKARRVHRCEFGHQIPEGARYLRKLSGPDRAKDAKLCEDCGVRFLHLLFGTGGGTAELATRLVRRQYGSLLVAMKQLDRSRDGTHREAQPLPTQGRRPGVESERAPKWSAERLAEVRRRHPRAYEKWSPAEDDRLRRLYLAGVGIEQMARDLHRQPSAIRSRLSKLGLAGERD